MAYHHASSSLMDAVESGDLAAVTEALSRSPDLHAKCNRDCIKTAVMNDGQQYQQILGALLEYGLTVNPSDANNANFLHAAVNKGYLQVLDDLLKYGAKVDVVISLNRSAGFSALQRAARNNHQEIEELLIKYGANPLIGSHWCDTPMFYFVTKANIKLVNLLLASNPSYKSIRYVLHTAVRSNSLEMVQTLVQHGVDVTTRDNTGWTALHVNSCSTNASHVKLQIAELLLSKGADVDARNASEATPLHLASAEADSVALAEVLLRHNANVNAANEYGDTPLHIAAEKGHKEMCVFLMKQGAMVNAKADSGKTPLYKSSRRGHAEVVKALLESGAILNLKNEFEPSALRGAIKSGNDKVVDIFLKWGADFDAKRFWANSLTKEGGKHWMSSETILKMLLNRGVDINKKGWKGYTALHFAAKYENHSAMRTLLKFGANINALTDNDSSTPLCLVADDAYSSSCKTLLEFGAAVNLANVDNETPLFRAAAKGCLENVVPLLHHGADINIASNTNETALTKAIVGWLYFNDLCEVMGNYIDKTSIEYGDGFLCEDIVKTLIRHFVKLQRKNKFVSDDNLRAVVEIEELENYQLNCEAEVSKMACDQITKRKMTYFDLLDKSVRSIAKLLNNECIRQELQSEQYQLDYVCYGEELKCLINQGLQRKKRLNQVEMLIKLAYPAMPHVCIDNILSFLRENDIRMN